MALVLQFETSSTKSEAKKIQQLGCLAEFMPKNQLTNNQKENHSSNLFKKNEDIKKQQKKNVTEN